ncbi:MAG: hypothetical protein PVJ39_05515 [Gammaproteobacteria bacterium]
MNGFVDAIWTLSDGTDEIPSQDGQFNTSGELDVESKLSGPMSMRLDADLNPSGTGGGDSGRLEQAFLHWDIDKNLGLKAGVFNNNLSWEKEDAPNMYQITHGQLYDLWNEATTLDGNNLEGVELSYKTGNINAFIGYLNDIGNAAEQNSMKVGAEIRATPDINVVVGLITQDQDIAPFMGNIIDVNATWKMDQRLTLGAELMLPDKTVDSGLMLKANYKVDQKFSATARYDMVSYDASGVDDTSSITLAGLYTIADGLYANGELRFNNDNNVPTIATTQNIGEGDGSTVRLELLATF